MSPPLKWRPVARREFDEAVDWYDEKANLGEDLIDEVQQTLNGIAAAPRRHALVCDDVRRAIVNRFPYSVFYRVTASAIEVLGIIHHRRDSSVWKRRR